MSFLTAAAGYTPVRFDNMQFALTAKLNVLVNSGVIVPSQKVTKLLSNGGVIFDMPFWNDLQNVPARISNSTAIPNLYAGGTNYPIPEGLTSGKMVGVRCSRNQSWGAADLQDSLNLDGDPLSFIAARSSTYQDWQLQAMFLAICAGLFADNDAAPTGFDTHTTGDMTLDISNANGAGVFTPGVTTFGAAAHIKATQLLGDNKGKLRVALMHSIIEASIALQDLVETIRDSQGVIQFKTFMGMRIVIDDDMTSPSTGVYDTYYFGLGAFAWGHGTPKRPLEWDRHAGMGNGAGGEVLYNRWEWCLHPMGFRWLIASTEGGPSDLATAGNLAHADSWSRVFPERKQTPIVRVRTREHT